MFSLCRFFYLRFPQLFPCARPHSFDFQFSTQLREQQRMSSGKAGEKKSIKFISFLVRAIFKTFCLALRLFYMRSNNYGLCFLARLFILTSADPKRIGLKRNDLRIYRYLPDTFPIRTRYEPAAAAFCLHLELSNPPSTGFICDARAGGSIYLLFYAYYPFTYSTLFHPPIHPSDRLNVSLSGSLPKPTYVHEFWFFCRSVRLLLFCFVHYLAPCSYFHIQGVLIEFFCRSYAGIYS